MQQSDEARRPRADVIQSLGRCGETAWETETIFNDPIDDEGLCAIKAIERVFSLTWDQGSEIDGIVIVEYL